MTNSSSNQALTIEKNIVKLKQFSESNDQTWLRTSPNKEGWFKLKNPASRKFLTYIDENTTTIEGITAININFKNTV